MPAELARVSLPTPYGTFEAHAYECSSGFVYLALVAGDIGDGRSALARVHSECLTGDALGSLRCDCGLQLRGSLKAIAAEGRGVLVYVTGHEGRGIGLVNKLRAYIEQDHGADTVDANLHMGLPVDGREYTDAARVLQALGVRSVRLLSNNPRKVEGLVRAGIQVDEVRTFPIAPHTRNASYLRTKRERLGHRNGVEPLHPAPSAPPDVGHLLGTPLRYGHRPYVVLKYAQSIDGRIATATGDARWISSVEERTVSHALRARCDAVLVGVGTVLADDPLLSVRLVTGASPLRVVLDSCLRTPLDAAVINDDAATMILTTARADVAKRADLAERDVAVRVLPEGPGGIDLTAALQALRAEGIETLLAEGGAEVITSLLGAGLVDRMIVALAPIVMGSGVDGVGDLGIARVCDSVALRETSVHMAGTDVLLAGDVTIHSDTGVPLRTE